MKGADRFTANDIVRAYLGLWETEFQPLNKDPVKLDFDLELNASERPLAIEPRIWQNLYCI